MAHKCPSCDAELKGFTTQANVEERLATKNEAIQVLKDELKGNQGAASQVTELRGQLATANKELSGFKDTSTLEAAKVAPEYHGSFLTMYRSAAADHGEGEAPSLEAWLADTENGAAADPLLKAHLGVSGDGGGGGEGGGSTEGAGKEKEGEQKPAPKNLPNGDKNAHRPAGSNPVKGAELTSVFLTPEYQAASAAEKRVILDEAEAKYRTM